MAETGHCWAASRFLFVCLICSSARAVRIPLWASLVVSFSNCFLCQHHKPLRWEMNKGESCSRSACSESRFIAWSLTQEGERPLLVFWPLLALTLCYLNSSCHHTVVVGTVTQQHLTWLSWRQLPFHFGARWIITAWLLAAKLPWSVTGFADEQSLLSREEKGKFTDIAIIVPSPGTLHLSLWLPATSWRR